jgi:hypothetical protein
VDPLAAQLLTPITGDMRPRRLSNIKVKAMVHKLAYLHPRSIRSDRQGCSRRSSSRDINRRMARNLVSLRIAQYEQRLICSVAPPSQSQSYGPQFQGQGGPQRPFFQYSQCKLLTLIEKLLVLTRKVPEQEKLFAYVRSYPFTYFD